MTKNLIKKSDNDIGKFRNRKKKNNYRRTRPYTTLYIDNYISTYLNTIATGWYFWKGIWTSKAHEPVTLSKNATFTKV